MARPSLQDAITVMPDGSIGGGSDEESAYNDFVDGLQGNDDGVTVRVYRCPTDAAGEVIPNAKLEQLFSAPVDRYNLDEIFEEVRSKFMPAGEVVCTIRLIGSRKGVRGTAFNRTMVIRKPIAAKPTSADNNAGDLLASVQRMIEAQQTRSDALMREMFTRLESNRVPTAPPVDPMANFVALITAVTPLVVPMLKAGASGGGGGLAPTLLDQVKTLRELRSLAGDLGGGGDSGDDESNAGILKSVASLAGPVLQLLANNQQAAPPRVAQRVLAAPQATPQAAPQAARPAVMAMPGPTLQTAPRAPQAVPAHSSTSNEDAAMLAMLRTQLNTLAQMATENADPKAVAELLLSQVPEAYDDALYNLVADDKAVDRLAIINPVVNAHREFFVALVAAILANYTTDVPPV